MSSFGTGEQAWINRLGNLRNTVRQELIRRQLTNHVRAAKAVLDVGCGQGTQAIELAKRGCTVTGIEPSTALRDLCRSDTKFVGVEMELLDGSIETLDAVLGTRKFDVVCAHGLLMYLDDRAAAIQALTQYVNQSGLVSLTFRNGHALAMRPGMRRDWTAALAAFDSPSYVNELGVDARADLLDDVVADLTACGMTMVTWYGVRVFNDAVASTAEIPDNENVVDLLAAEEQAGRHDPYRWMASQFHIIAQRQ